MSLQDKLEQVEKDKYDHNVKFDEEIAILKDKIADAEVTYSIGDRFKDGTESKKMLVAISGEDCRRVMFSNLSNGHGGDITVKNWYKITLDEMPNSVQDGSCTRYWDDRKQEKVSE
jgi:6-phosphogluconolactonase/glucosamine-6-phosphate isomerase/deaminase